MGKLYVRGYIDVVRAHNKRSTVKSLVVRVLSVFCIVFYGTIGFSAPMHAPSEAHWLKTSPLSMNFESFAHAAHAAGTVPSQMVNGQRMLSTSRHTAEAHLAQLIQQSSLDEDTCSSKQSQLQRGKNLGQLRVGAQPGG